MGFLANVDGLACFVEFPRVLIVGNQNGCLAFLARLPAELDVNHDKNWVDLVGNHG